MRPRLLNPTRRRPHERGGRRRRRRGRAHGAVAVVVPQPPAPATTPPARNLDPIVARVREAGGPIDCASYSCSCGYVFRAAVSTTVSCPHCGAGQAW